MISQREARFLRKENERLRGILKAERNCYSSEWPGIHLDTITVQPSEWWVVETARRLGHGVVVVPNEVKGIDHTLRLYGARNEGIDP